MITDARYEPGNPDREIDLKEDLEASLQRLIEAAEVAGYGREETCEALVDLMSKIGIGAPAGETSKGAALTMP